MAYNKNPRKSVSPIDPSCRKTIYNSRAEAEDMIAYIHETRITKELHAYQCQVCGLWHLSSRSN